MRERGEYNDQDEAADVTNAVLEVLAQRISPGEIKDLASQLPGPLGQVLDRAAPQRARSFVWCPSPASAIRMALSLIRRLAHPCQLGLLVTLSNRVRRPPGGVKRAATQVGRHRVSMP